MILKARFVAAAAIVLTGLGTAQARLSDEPKPEVYVRPEDQQRARLLRTPCTKADNGRGCHYSGDFLMRDFPCLYQIDANTLGSLPTDQCVKMQKPQRYRGVWIDAFEGQQFIPEGTVEPVWPGGRLTSPRIRRKFEQARLATIWLDVERVNLAHDFRKNGRRVRIDFIGRKTLYPGSYGHMGMSGNEIIVDRVISAKPID